MSEFGGTSGVFRDSTVGRQPDFMVADDGAFAGGDYGDYTVTEWERKPDYLPDEPGAVPLPCAPDSALSRLVDGARANAQNLLVCGAAGLALVGGGALGHYEYDTNPTVHAKIDDTFGDMFGLGMTQQERDVAGAIRSGLGNTVEVECWDYATGLSGRSLDLAPNANVIVFDGPEICDPIAAYMHNPSAYDPTNPRQAAALANATSEVTHADVEHRYAAMFPAPGARDCISALSVPPFVQEGLHMPPDQAAKLIAAESDNTTERAATSVPAADPSTVNVLGQRACTVDSFPGLHIGS